MIDEIRDILTNYPETTRNNRPNGLLPVCISIKNINQQVSDILTDPGWGSLIVKYSWGKGAWTPIPWVAILDSTYTTTTQHWYYPVLLFRADGSGFYLSLSVATGRPYGTPSRRQLVEVADRAQRFKPWFSTLQNRGIEAEPEMDLRIEKGVGVGYRYGSVVHKYYDRNALPTDPNLTEDILSLTRAYQDFCQLDDARDLYHELSGTAEVPGVQISRPNSNSRSNGQGFSTDSKYRSMVEKYAVDRAIKHFEDLNWIVDPSPQANKPYDLLCKRGEAIIYVEVKGTTTKGSEVTITNNEAKHAFANPDKSVLLVVADIELQPSSGRSVECTGCRDLIAELWNLKETQLSPINYRCKLDGV